MAALISALSGIAFQAPALLAGLLLLPALWWLLRMTPPPPKREVFPAVRLLADLPQEEETPARTPWWLMALRLLIAALIITGLAHPVSAPGNMLSNRDGTVILVIDSGWASARGWSARQDAMDALLLETERQGRFARLVTTAPPGDGSRISVGDLLPARDLRPIVRALQPRPWETERRAALSALEQLQDEGAAEIFWITDGLEETTKAKDASGKSVAMASEEFALALQKIGPVSVLKGDPSDLPLSLTINSGVDKGLKPGEISFLIRQTPQPIARPVALVARDPDGRILDRRAIDIPAGKKEINVGLNLPNEVRNRVSAIEIENQKTASAVFLTDERWRRRSVGLVSGQNVEKDQPLLSNHYYLQKALEPVADTKTGTIRTLLKSNVSVLVLADVGRVTGSNRSDLERWIDGGGVLVRFAGPKMAESDDDFVPVRLRTGNRVLAGAMTWSTPLPLMPFEDTSPFHGLSVPEDVLIRQQVLAEPASNLSDRTWARLKDGTPIVTAEKRGKGWLVLVHATANADWSDLPFSGLFIGMLERLVDLAHGASAVSSTRAELKALLHLDAFGRLHEPTSVTKTLGKEGRVAPGRPPGFYGTDSARQALNLGPSLAAPEAIAILPRSIGQAGLVQKPELDLKPWLLTAAAVLLIVDLFISLLMRGLLPGLRRRKVRTSVATSLVVAFVLASGLLFFSGQGYAQTTEDEFAMAASLDTRLAYILTGDQAVDAMSEAGLTALTEVIRSRTSVEGNLPLGVDPEIDELVFFPLIYWPVTANQPRLSDSALARVDAYMKNGGTILFDTRDQQFADVNAALGESTPERHRLMQMLRRLDVPPLIPVPQKHILTRAFYLMQDWPGRWSGGKVWVERHNGGINDGVSGLVIGGHDWAAAWATDADGRPLAAVVPEGPRQRELAYRFGVNLVMYVLTGNYKADQVHVPALLERLGQ